MAKVLFACRGWAKVLFASLAFLPATARAADDVGCSATFAWRPKCDTIACQFARDFDPGGPVAVGVYTSLIVLGLTHCREIYHGLRYLWRLCHRRVSRGTVLLVMLISIWRMYVVERAAARSAIAGWAAALPWTAARAAAAVSPA